MSEKYLMVKSYAHAGSLGIQPVDSIISISGVVIEAGKTKPPYTVVGYAEGWTYKQGDVMIPDNLKTYRLSIPNDAEDWEIHAINDDVAKMIAREMYNPPYKLYQVKTEYIPIADIRR